MWSKSALKIMKVKIVLYLRILNADTRHGSSNIKNSTKVCKETVAVIFWNDTPHQATCWLNKIAPSIKPNAAGLNIWFPDNRKKFLLSIAIALTVTTWYHEAVGSTINAMINPEVVAAKGINNFLFLINVNKRSKNTADPKEVQRIVILMAKEYSISAVINIRRRIREDMPFPSPNNWDWLCRGNFLTCICGGLWGNDNRKYPSL